MSQPCDVLVIEDDPGVRELVVELLEDLRLSVASAADGAEGIRRLLTNHPRIVLLDLVMPVVNGHRVIEFMKSIPSLARVPVIPMTGTNRPGALRKPFTFEELVAALDPYITGLAERVSRLDNAPRKSSSDDVTTTPGRLGLTLL